MTLIEISVGTCKVCGYDIDEYIGYKICCNCEIKYCHCGDEGWYAVVDPHTGEPMQVQCEFCETEESSYFNYKRNTSWNVEGITP